MIALDTNIIIYALEAHPQFGQKASAILRNLRGNIAVSEIIYLEFFSSSVFQDAALRDQSLAFLEEQGFDFVPTSKSVLLLAAELRAHNESRLDLGDALHLASALYVGADTFITNDKALTEVKIKNLKITTL